MEDTKPKKQHTHKAWGAVVRVTTDPEFMRIATCPKQAGNSIKFLI